MDVAALARTVLYEGYLLWPYRRSAVKNHYRFTIGGLYPASYASRFADRSRARFQCLVEGPGPRIDLEVRFLRIVRRQAYVHGRAVDDVIVDGERYLSWDEATEQVIEASDVVPPCVTSFAYPSGNAEERLDGESVLRRSWEELSGCAALRAQERAPALWRLDVEIANESGWDGEIRDEALRRTLAACHVVLRVRDGAFVSPLEAEDCVADGLWPSLVGEPGDRSTILASPMILGDYPALAAESPGDLFDGGEIDELLIHSIRALTDDERAEMRAADPRAREMLERTLALGPDELARLHGALRDRPPAASSPSTADNLETS